MRHSSSEDEDRSTTGTFSEGPPCSNTGERGWREEISNWDPGGGGDPDSASGGVEPPLGKEEPSLEGERERLVSLLSFIMAKKRREENPKQGSEGMQDGYQRKMKEIFIVGKHHGATLTDVISIPACPLVHIMRRLFKHASKLSNFLEKGTQRHDSHTATDKCIANSSMCIEHIINIVNHRMKTIRRLKVA
jgi:hypothetical protein